MDRKYHATIGWLIVVIVSLSLGSICNAQNVAPHVVPKPPAGANAIEGETIRRTHIDANAPTTNPAGATSKTSANPQNAFDVRRVAMALGVVLVLILGLRWVGKRYFTTSGSQRASRAIQVISRSILSPKQQLMLVQVGRRIIVVADSGTQMNPLCEITDADEIAELVGQVHQEKGDSITKTFGQLFGRAKNAFEREDAGDSSAASESKPADSPSDESDSSLLETRQELSGLADRIRLLSRQFRSG